jgi:hypothetical protein
VTGFHHKGFSMTNVRFASVALILFACLTGAASAQTVTAPAQPEHPTLKPDPGTTGQINCISEEDTFARIGAKPAFVIKLENKCQQRLTCRVYAYVTSAKGATLGHGTLVLAAASKGGAAKKSFTMRVKMTDGNSQSTRECRAI